MSIQKSPIVKKEPPRKVAWCACGESQNQPYCDGSHSAKNTGKTPIIVDITEEKTVAWCACKQSGNKPYCDGTHSRI